MYFVWCAFMWIWLLCFAGERAMKLLDAGEGLPPQMILDLVTTKLASRECQKSGWVLEGVDTAVGGVDELEEAIVMATEVCLKKKER